MKIIEETTLDKIEKNRYILEYNWMDYNRIK